MEELKLTNEAKNALRRFTQGLKEVYQESLISLILYGSAASGEFTDTHSNINLMVILDNTSLENLAKISALINKREFKNFNPLFFSEEYIRRSTDVFPIEFLDLQENYLVLCGKDVLKGINIDTRNLRFQCEQELKAKLISLRQLYLRANKNSSALGKVLFKSFSSMLHILRNVLRLKGKKPPYLKQEIIKELALEFQIDQDIWEKICAAKMKQVKLSNQETRGLFISFVRELEKIVEIVDKL